MKLHNALALVLLAAPSLADTLVLEVPNIEGDSTVPGFVDAIDLGNYSFGASGFGGSSSTYFFATGDRDRSFPPLLLACLEGDVLGTVRMSVVAGNGTVRAELELTSAVCSSATVSLGSEAQGTQSYTFEFATADWQYFGTGGKGKDSVGQPGSSTTPPGSAPENMTNLALGGGGPSGLFLELGDIPGGSTVNGYQGYLEPSSASWGAANQGGFRVFQNLHASGDFDPSLPQAYQQLLDNKVLGAPVELELATNGQTAFKIVLTSSKVRGVDTFGSAAGDPSLGYSLDYETVQIFHTIFGANGQPQSTLVVGWDLIGDTEL